MAAPRSASCAESASGGKLTASHSAVLPPFDPVWDRKRAEQIIQLHLSAGMLYPSAETAIRLLCTTLLHRGKLVGRMDSKLHRKGGVLEIFSLWLEEGLK